MKKSPQKEINIGFVHCMMIEDETKELQDWLQQFVPPDVNINLDIFCPNEHRDQFTDFERNHHFTYPLWLCMEQILSLVEKWQETTHLILISGPIFNKIDSALGVPCSNLSEMGCSDNFISKFRERLREFFEKISVEFNYELFQKTQLELTDYGMVKAGVRLI